MAKVTLTVAISEDCLDDILEIAQKLRAVGMQVNQIMDTLGVVVGSSDAEQVGAIAQVEGVESVESAHSYHLSPPQSHLQ